RRGPQGREYKRPIGAQKEGAAVAPSRPPPRSSLTLYDYRFTSFWSLAGSPDGLFASAVQLPPAENTRESLEMLHWSTVVSASMLPSAKASNRVAGVPEMPAAELQAVAL